MQFRVLGQAAVSCSSYVAMRFSRAAWVPGRGESTHVYSMGVYPVCRTYNMSRKTYIHIVAPTVWCDDTTRPSTCDDGYAKSVGSISITENKTENKTGGMGFFHIVNRAYQV